MEYIALSSTTRRPEVFREVFERALHGKWCHAAETAERALQHRIAQLFQQFNVPLTVDALDDPVDHFDAARRTDPARCALAAGLMGTELHRKTRHVRHVDGVVKNDDAAVAEQRTDG